jgi:hypothetical protein
MRRTTLVLAAAVVATLASGCAGGPAAPSAPAASAARTDASPIASATAAASLDPWAQDLAQVDAGVRASHPNPFANNPEAVWVAKLAELRKTLPTATPDQRVVQFASLIGLLDTHSGLTGPFHAYDVLLYPFSDGWFVDEARDLGLIGDRVVSIGGHPIADVEAAMRPLVPADNESGELDGLQVISTVEYLHGLGIVDDPAKPAFVFARPDGTQMTVDLTFSNIPDWERALSIDGGLNARKAPEAVARRGEPVWTRLDKPTKTFVISYNDYTEDDLAPALAAMKDALDDGSARRILLDMRYIRGGNGGLSAPLTDALIVDPRINRPGGLIVMIGRENVSAGTVVARTLDTGTQAVFVGEMTPARADGFLCECRDIELTNSGLTVEIPTFQFGIGDKRLAIEPDVPVALSAADFFAGKDPALKIALALKDPPAP